jgi:hypothetical protein
MVTNWNTLKVLRRNVTVPGMQERRATALQGNNTSLQESAEEDVNSTNKQN